MASGPRPDLLVLGTRPEIIKLGPVYRELLRRGTSPQVVHTGQHYDSTLSEPFLDVFGIEVTHQLDHGAVGRGAQIGRMTDSLSTILAADPPRTVIVQGDTNSALAGALAANAVEIPLVHVEAGLRSHDRTMPEEHNRIVVDFLADALAAPTATAADALRAGGIAEHRIAITGNTVMDALEQLGVQQPDAAPPSHRFGVTGHDFILATIHRPENTDDPTRLRSIIDALVSAPLPVLFPLHPRTRAALHTSGLTERVDLAVATKQMEVTEPLDYRTFLSLLRDCAFAVSDSGGIQEEVTAFATPLIVVRRSTERPEVIGSFAERVSADDASILDAVVAARCDDFAALKMKLSSIPSPFRGPGNTSPAANVVDQIRSIT